MDPSGDGGIGVHHYELEEDNAYASVRGDNAYDSVNPAGPSAASTSKPPGDSLPPVYAAVDKNNREGKTVGKSIEITCADMSRQDASPPPLPPSPPPSP